MNDEMKAAAKADALAEKALRREYDFAGASEMHAHPTLSKAQAQYQVWRNLRVSAAKK